MTRSLASFTDVALRRMEGGVISREGAVTVIRSPHNPSFWWGNFVLMPAPPAAGDLERWEALFTRHHPAAAHRTFAVDTADGEAGDPAPFVDAGYVVLRDTVLTAPRTRPPRRVSTDVTVRPLDSDTDWAGALALRLAVNAADPDGHEAAARREFASRKLASCRRAQAAGRGVSFGAFDDRGAVLSSLGVFDVGEGVARYQSVETRPDARSRGLAGTLVHTAGEWAREHLGTRTLVIVADPDYHAQALYERVGFTPTEVQLAFQKRPADS